MILNGGEYIHVIHRQLFPGDAQRHFVGTVEAHEGALVRVKGYLFAMDSTQSQFVRREELRTRVISLNDAVIVNHLHASAEWRHSCHRRHRLASRHHAFVISSRDEHSF